tara:strand:+ start:353 stop:793 length:441 start_codon:yes stop_codon:yes gene_type:complete
MAKNHKKEQFIAIFTLASVFALFIFLKLTPEVKIANNDSDVIESIIQEKVKEIESSISEEILINDETDNNIGYSNLETKDIIISYTDKELKRAQLYIQKNWKADHTINNAAWKYAQMTTNNKNNLTKENSNQEEKNNSNQFVNNSN